MNKTCSFLHIESQASRFPVAAAGLVFFTIGGDGNQVESGRRNGKQARNGMVCSIIGTIFGPCFTGLERSRSELEVMISSILEEIDEAIESIHEEYDVEIRSIPDEFPAAIKCIIKGVLEKHEMSIKGLLEKYKMAIKDMLMLNGMQEENYDYEVIEGMREEFELAINTHLSKKFLLSLLCKTVAEQIKEAIMRRFQWKTH